MLKRITKKLLGFMLLGLLLSCTDAGKSLVENSQSDKISCFVSILPQSYVVNKLAQEFVTVKVLVDPGQSPETYEPKHKQLAELSHAKAFFTIGVPFERVLLERMTDSLNLRVVDTLKNIELKECSHNHSHHEGEDHHHANEKDPHVWLDPLLVKIQAQTIAISLIDLIPKHKSEIEKNLLELEKELEKLYKDIVKIFSEKTRNQVWVYHPAYSYFCERFGLEQVAIEKEGKEPGAKELGNLIIKAKKNNIQTIFVQQQFMGKAPVAISRELNCQIITIDPLAYNYTENLLSIAKQICQTLK